MCICKEYKHLYLYSLSGGDDTLLECRVKLEVTVGKTTERYMLLNLYFLLSGWGRMGKGSKTGFLFVALELTL